MLGKLAALSATVTIAVLSTAVPALAGAQPIGASNTALAGVTAPFGAAAMARAATTTVPFKYKAEWAANLEGRFMRTNTTVFCNDYASTYVELPVADTHTYIQLVRSNAGIDTKYAKVKYPNDGIKRGYCWTGRSNSETYYFTYRQTSTNGLVRAGGYVHG